MKTTLIIISSIALSLSLGARDMANIRIFYSPLGPGEADPVKEFPFHEYAGDIQPGKYIHVMPEMTFQTMEGIGGAFNENGGEALLSLAEPARQEVMERLFASTGAAFSFCRTAIGASDFGLDAYSYSDVPEDFEMEHFSIKRDQKYVIPYIQAALRVNPSFKLFASPWSPPAWMKENGKMAGVDHVHSRLRNDKRIYRAYGIFFAKYIKSYRDNGINISRICVQNETDVSSKYPSCLMSAEQLLELALHYIKPALRERGLDTEVYGGTFRTWETLELYRFMNLPEAAKVDGISVQYTDPRYIHEIQQVHPGFKFMHSEGKCFNGANSIEEAASRLGEIADNINAGCVSYCYWNMILNETTLSTWDWPQDSLINIDRDKKSVRFNPDYNVLSLVGKFIRPGDVRVAAFTRGPIIGMKDPSGDLKLIVQNDAPEKKAYLLNVNDQKVKFELPGRAVCAIVVPASYVRN